MILTEFKDGPERPRNPLGGREADGFGAWIETTHAAMVGMLDVLPQDHKDRDPGLMMADAELHYRRIMNKFRHVRDESAPEYRDQLETALISDVMRAHGKAAYARRQSDAGLPARKGRQSWGRMCGEYLRACMILGEYLGVSQLLVAECGDDQAALSALRA